MRALLVAAALAAAGCNSEVAFTPKGKPEQITTLASSSGVDLFWEVVPGASGYRVYELVGGDVTDTEYDLPFASIPFTGAELRLQIAARRGNAESERSPEIVVLRQPDHISPSPVWVATSHGLAFGSAITGAGDVDEDGFEDVLIGAPATSGGGGVFLFRGRGAGLVNTPAWFETVAGTSEELGASLAYSETHLDGEPAWIVGAPGGAGRAYVYPKGPGATLGTPTYHDAPAGFENRGFGRTVVSAGNLDGELNPRRDEIAIAAPGGPEGGRVFLYPGVSSVPDPQAFPRVEVRLQDAPDGELGAAMAAAGNLETDPADDLLLGAPGYSASFGGVVTLHGSPSLFYAPELVFPGVDFIGDHPGERFGASLASVGDADDDDRNEFVVGAPMHDCENELDDPSDDYFESGRIVIVDPDDVPIPTTTCGETGQRVGTSLHAAGTVFNDQEQLLVGALAATGGHTSTSGLPGVPPQGFFRFDRVYRPSPPPGPKETPALELEHFPDASGISGEGVGRVLATSDVNGDGRPDVLVGIPDRGARGTVLLYVTIPVFGPEVHAGPLIDAPAGSVVHLDAAFVTDTVDAEYECSIDWGVPGVPPWTSGGGCTAEILRGAGFPYDPPPEGEDFEDHPVRVTVATRDGRTGLGLTRVRVRR